MSDQRRDDRLAGYVLAHLEKNSPDPLIREMAQEVRSGRTTLGDALASGFYSDALEKGMTGFLEWRRRQDPEALAREAEHYAAQEAELNRRD